jgi:hypothetical protein
MTDQTKTQKEYPDFCNEVNSLTAEQLKARIVQLQQGLEESEAAKDVDEELIQATAFIKILREPYRDIKKAVKAKTSYLIELLKNQGK